MPCCPSRSIASCRRKVNLMRQQVKELLTIVALVALVFTLALLAIGTLIFVVVVVPGGRL
jgi:hypothetical protein